MCGVFGFISKRGKGPSLDRLTAIATATETRGPHSFGFAWLDKTGRLRMFKQEGKISDSLGLLSMAREARAIIGHCRWATHGEPSNNLNNHPHPADGGWYVHNGVVHNYDNLAKEQDWPMVSECDTEIIGRLLEQAEGSLSSRVESAVDNCAGDMTVLGLWKPGRLIAVRRGNPLNIGHDRNGIYFGSLPDNLPNPKELPDLTMVEYKTGHRVKQVRRELSPDAAEWGFGAHWLPTAYTSGMGANWSMPARTSTLVENMAINNPKVDPNDGIVKYPDISPKALKRGTGRRGRIRQLCEEAQGTPKKTKAKRAAKARNKLAK